MHVARARRFAWFTQNPTAGRKRARDKEVAMGVLVQWLILSFALWLSSVIIPGVHVRGFGGAILALLHFFLGWLIFGAIGVATLGIGFLLAFLTRFAVDVILLKITDKLTTKLDIVGIMPAVLAALLMAAVGTLGDWALRQAA